HRREEARGDASHIHWARLALDVPARYARIRKGDVGEAVLDAPNEVEVGIRFVVVLATNAAVDVPGRHDCQEAIWFRHADAREEERLERRKDERVGAERERHREDGDS